MAKTTTKAELEAQVAELRAQLAALQAAPAPVAAPAPTYVTPVSTDVTLVYTSDSMGVIKYSQGELMCNRYGEEFVLPRYAFDEIVGKYRKWFDKGILAVSVKNADVAKAKGVPTDADCGGLSYDKLSKLGTMSVAEIEKLWNNLPKKELKATVIYFFKDKFMQDAPGFRDVARIDALNRLSNGGLDAERDQVGGKNHINPTDFCEGSKDRIKVII